MRTTSTRYNDHESLERSLGALCDEAKAAMSRYVNLADAVEFSVKRKTVWGFALTGQDICPIAETQDTQLSVKAFDSGRVGFSKMSGPRVDIDAGIELALEGTMPGSRGPVFTGSRHGASPMSYDPRLLSYLGAEGAFAELAEAVLDNTWHEAGRIPGLQSAEGTIRYEIEECLASVAGETVTSIAGALTTELTLNGGFGEYVVQVQAPESMLPTALIGARSWRNCPKTSVQGLDGAAVGLREVVLHPRVTEALLRKYLPALIGQKDAPFGIGRSVGCSELTIIDDPRLDGLRTSRSFDDQGVATSRLALVVDGRVTSGFRERSKPTGCGHLWLSDNGDLHQSLSSLLVNRGDEGFHRLLDASPNRIIINRIGPFSELDLQAGRFACPIEWAVWVRKGLPNQLLSPGSLTLEGSIFGGPSQGETGIFSGARLSHELNDTGSAVLPYLFTQCIVRPSA